MKIVFIAGTGRSGSTLLNAFLGKSSSILAVGELISSRHELYKRLKNQICACETEGEKCIFWHDFIDFSNENAELEYHEALVKFTEKNYPEKKIIVDSSKDITALLYWLKLKETIPSLEIYTIHLVRDVRGWVYSWYKRRPNEPKLKRIIWLIIKCLSWYRRNKELDKNITNYSMSFIRVGYEEFIFYRHKILDLIFSYVDEPNLISDYHSLTDSNAHELSEFSSSMKKNKSIQYDYFWMMNWPTSFFGTFFPLIFRMNKKFVYSNIGPKRRISGSEDYLN
jgi:hypothetical protein